MLQVKLRLQFCSILLAIISLFLVAPKAIFASTLFEDNFDSENADKWIVIGNSGWNILDNQYGIHIDPGVSNTIPNDTEWNYNWQNIIFEVDLRGVAGTDKNILVKFVDSDNFIEIHHTDGNIYLEKHSIAGGSGILDVEHHPLENNIVYHFKIIIDHGYIQVYINNELILQGNENSPLLQNWRIGLRAGTGATRPTEVWFDNVLISDLPASTPIPTPTPTPLPNLSVPEIKQYSPPWGSKVYDHATSWSNNPTITNWGCALTSADMLLQFYGFPINPGDLNTWLNSQSDGYIGNGLLNWLAISRYSKTHSTTQPSLEFLRQGNTNSNLINELVNNRPAILEEPGHFVVATGQTPTTFKINDPAYSNHPTLDSYGNTFLSLETYIPSHTNLSYILLTIDPNFGLKIFDTNGNEITGDTFIQNPLTDDVNNISKSGNPLQTFMFPKPLNGNYKVQITGSGIYKLDSYLYDINGNVNLKKTNGIIGNNQSDEFQIMIGDNNSTNQAVSIDLIIQDWDNTKAQNKIKNQGIYNDIKVALNLTKILIKNKNNKLAKITLKSAANILKIATPKFVDPTASNILQLEIQALINSL